MSLPSPNNDAIHHRPKSIVKRAMFSRNGRDPTSVDQAKLPRLGHLKKIRKGVHRYTTDRFQLNARVQCWIVGRPSAARYYSFPATAARNAIFHVGCANSLLPKVLPMKKIVYSILTPVKPSNPCVQGQAANCYGLNFL